MMKFNRTILILGLFLFTIKVYSQSDIVIYQESDVVLRYGVHEVKKIEFKESNFLVELESSNLDTIEISLIKSIRFSESETVGFDDFQNTSESITIFPNPVDKDLKFNTNAPNISKVIITDLNGRVIKNYDNIATNSLDVSDMPHGVYIIQIKFKNQEVQNSKFIKL